MKNLFELASFVLITSCVLIAFASPAFARPDPTWIVAESTLLDYGSSTELGSDGAIHGDRVIVSGPFGATVYRGVSGGNLEFEATLRPLLAADNAIYVHTAIQEDMIALGIRYDSDGPDDVLQVYEREGTEWALTYAEVYENYRGYGAEIQGVVFDDGRLIVSLRAELEPPDYPTSSWLSVLSKDTDGTWDEVQTLPENPFDPVFYDRGFGEFMSARGGLLLAIVYRPFDDQSAPDRVLAYTYADGAYKRIQEFVAPDGTSRLFGESTAVNEQLIAIIQSQGGAYVAERGSLEQSAALVELPLPMGAADFGDRIALGQGAGADLIAVRVEVDDEQSVFGHTEVAIYRYNGGDPTYVTSIASEDVVIDGIFFGEELGVNGQMVMATSSVSVAPDEAVRTNEGEPRNGSVALYDCAMNCSFSSRQFGSSPNSLGFGVEIATSSSQIFVRQLTGSDDPDAVVHVFDVPTAGTMTARASQVLTLPDVVSVDDVGKGTFGERFAVSDEVLALTGYDGTAPVVFVYRYRDGQWRYVATIDNPEPPPASSLFFGKSLAVVGGEILIGDTTEDGELGVVYRAVPAAGDNWTISTDFKREGEATRSFGSVSLRHAPSHTDEIE